jgi:DMSO/TMAO reductase YedYZ molybdopterin-dependent catalytic subunit
MKEERQIAKLHEEVTRRYFLKVSTAGAAGLTLPCFGADSSSLSEVVSKLEYLTRDEDFRFFGRVDPKPWQLSLEERKAEGLERDSWQLEVIGDPDSDPVIENPLSKELGTAFNWEALMELAKTRAVRLMSVLSCTNTKTPCGMGLWEGVPLRDVIWLAKPSSNIRRLYYYGFHNQDTEQIFQSSLPISRVLEDPPGEHPVLLCYKLNEEWLSLNRGGPVRMLVPGQYGNKSVKWIQRVMLTNNYKANDTYALKNNDTASAMKSCARFIHVPSEVKSGVDIPITGLAQVGMSGLKKVQYCLLPKGTSFEDDPYFTGADWKDADILNPPENWGGGLKDGKITKPPVQFDPKSGKPRQWPIRYAIAHWATVIKGLKAGRYDLRCRTIDANGVAQPMPRPFRKSGNNTIEKTSVIVTD